MVGLMHSNGFLSHISMSVINWVIVYTFKVENTNYLNSKLLFNLIQGLDKKFHRFKPPFNSVCIF